MINKAAPLPRASGAVSSSVTVSASPASASVSRQWSSSMFTTIRACSGRPVTGLSRAASRPDRLARTPGCQPQQLGPRLQHGPRHRHGTPRPRFDKQELLFHTYAARTHRPTLPADRFSIQQARD